MLLAPPVVIIDWLITFVLKRLQFAFPFAGLKQVYLWTWTIFAFRLSSSSPFCGHPFLPPVGGPPSPTLDLFLSSTPLPLLLGKASVLTDGSSSLPVGALGPLKWSLLCWPAGPASSSCRAEDPGLPYGFPWAKHFRESSGRGSSSCC